MDSMTFERESEILESRQKNAQADPRILLEAKDNEHPFVIKFWLQDEIELETIVILDSITGFMQRENSKITETIIWPDIYRKITKYKPFVKFDRNKCLNLLKKTFT